MKNKIALSFAAAAIAGVSACSSSTGGGSTPTGMGDVRLANGIADTTTGIDASIEGVSTTLNAVFGTGTGFAAVPIGSYKVTMTAQGTGGQPVDIVDDGVSVDHNVQTTVYAVGVLASSSQTSITVARPTTSFGTNQTEVQFVNATSATNLVPGILKVYFVTPGSGLGGITTPAGNFTPVQLRSQLDTTPADQSTPVFQVAPVLFTSGNYEVIVTGPLSTTALYDSGPGAGIGFTSGQTLQIAIMDVTSAQAVTYGATLQLALMDNSTGTSTAFFNGTH